MSEFPEITPEQPSPLDHLLSEADRHIWDEDVLIPYIECPPCYVCRGRGRWSWHVCVVCNGTGRNFARRD